MSTIHSLTGSSTPRFLLCPESARDDGVRVDEPSEAATLGTVVHRRLAETLGGMDLTPFPETVAKDEADLLVALALKLWHAKLAPFFGDSFEVEAPLVTPMADNGIADMSTRVDVLKTMATAAMLADWKTDRERDDEKYVDQLRAMCLIVFLRHPWIEQFSASLVWIRHAAVVTYRWTGADMQDFANEIREKMMRPYYNPGEHCEFCPRRLTCEVRRRWLGESCAFLLPPADASAILNEIEPTGLALVDVLSRLRAVEAACTVARKAIKQHILDKGSIPTVEGKAMRVVQQNRREVDARRALPILRALLDNDDLAACVDIRIAEAERRIKASLPRGEKTKAMKELAEALEQAGAVTLRPIDMVKEVSVDTTGDDEA